MRRPLHTRESLAHDLRALGLAKGDTVMVHASVRAVGEIAGGPDQIHLAIRDVITSNGTLFMYASCPQYVDEVGRGNLSPEEEAEVLEKLPAFDALTARSDRSNGALVELLRTWPGTRVNDHPARFAVWGAGAEHLLDGQPWDFAFGAGSLLERFVERDGRVLLLGSDHDNVTFLHYAEHIVDIPDKRIATFRVPVMQDGQRVFRTMREYDTSNGIHPQFPSDIFSRIVDTSLRDTDNVGGTVGHARSYLIPARGLLAQALSVMTKLAKEFTFGDVLQGLRNGDFSALEPVVVGSDSPSRVERWTLEGRFDGHPAELAEALSCAAFLGHDRLVTFLLDRGVAPAAGNATGLDAMHWAVNRGQLETVRTLLARTSPAIPLDTRNAYGGSLLGTAIWSALNEPKPHHRAIISLLVNAKAPCDPSLHPCGDEEIDALLRSHLARH